MALHVVGQTTDSDYCKRCGRYGRLYELSDYRRVCADCRKQIGPDSTPPTDSDDERDESPDESS